jgi:hypothetical protein
MTPLKTEAKIGELMLSYQNKLYKLYKLKNFTKKLFFFTKVIDFFTKMIYNMNKDFLNVLNL